MDKRTARNQAWQRYWQSDRIASCVPGRPETTDIINEHWRRFFEDVADGSRILDVATGNGAVIRQAAASAGTRHLALTGVDLADIDPLRHAPADYGERVSLQFRGGVDAADLPFDDASYDVIVSQYGLEYARLEPAIDEAGRVLRPGGCLYWLAHSEDSEVVRQNREQYRQVDLLLDEHGPLEAMAQLIRRIQRGKSVKIAMSRLNRAMQVAEKFCREHPPAAIVTEVCSGLAETANRWQAYDPRDLESMVDNSKQALVLHRQRILDLGDAVMTPARLEVLHGRLSGSLWRDPSVEPLKVGAERDTLGLIIRASRSALPFR